MNGTKSYSDAMHHYVKLLLELHHLYLAGKSETDEADEVRDLMDGPWREMTSHEISITDGLSADLYSIGRNRDIKSDDSVSGIRKTIGNALSRHDLLHVLSLVRDHENRFTRSDVAFMRGNAWLQLGFPDVALEFLEEMIKCGDVRPLHELLFFQAAENSKRYDFALHRINSYNDSTDPILWMAACICISKYSEFNLDKKDSILKAISAGERAFAMIAKPDAVSDVNPQMAHFLVVATRTMLGLDRLVLNQIEESRHEFEWVLRLEPENENAMIMLQLLPANNLQPNPESRRILEKLTSDPFSRNRIFSFIPTSLSDTQFSQFSFN